ncbi:hypothetical protein F1189_29720 [Rhodovastum atsumiense]|uniref:Uncharacterized protein n=1 Tax=Rhodovastum atsumiense TaxID=504468 RepID=A0A5M6IKW9_9PROT|nr:hypothetical protein F1189_29720 [Rhodovastum atsumiense]
MSKAAAETEKGALADAPEVSAAKVARLHALAAACPLAGAPPILRH